MKNEERVIKFKSQQLAVNCKTKEQAKKFCKWCYENGLEWKGNKVDKICWYYGDKTCYTYNNRLLHSYISNTIKNGYKIITYQDFFKDEGILCDEISLYNLLNDMKENIERVKNIVFELEKTKNAYKKVCRQLAEKTVAPKEYWEKWGMEDE